MACTFLGSIPYPAGVGFSLKNAQSWNLNTNFFALKVRFLTLAVSSRVMTATSWVVSLLPWQRISSTIPTLLGTLFRTLSILSWKTSPDTSSPKGRCSHRYLPQGVLKVVRKLLSLSRETCQYPDFASTSWNTSNLLIPVRCHRLFCCTTDSSLSLGWDLLDQDILVRNHPVS